MTIINTQIQHLTGYITLNRPEKRNALNPLLIEALTAALIAFRDNIMVKTIVIQAEGAVFSAGADLDYMLKLKDNSYEENLQDSMLLANLFYLIHTIPKIVIAKVQGHAIAGGCGLASIADFSFVAQEAKLGYTEVKIGFVPALVSCFLTNKVGITKAKELLYTGKLISATEAQAINLINFTCPFQQLNNQVESFCNDLNTHSSAQSIAYTKKLFSQVINPQFQQQLQQAAKINAEMRQTDDFAAGINSFVTKNKINW